MKPALPELPHIDAHRREIVAAKLVLQRVQANSKRFSIKALSLMTIGHGAFRMALRYHA